MTDPFDHVAELSAWLQASDIDLLELRGPSGTLRLIRQDGRTISTVEDDVGTSRPTVLARSSGVGVFLDHHPLRLEPGLPADGAVSAGAPIGFLRVGSLITAVLSPTDGVVIAMLAEPGSVVGYGTPLFEIEPTESEPVP